MKRRDFTKLMASAGVGAMLPWQRLHAISAAPGLSDPALQPKFVNAVPDALAPSFIYQPDKQGRYKIKVGTNPRASTITMKRTPQSGIPKAGNNVPATSVSSHAAAK